MLDNNEIIIDDEQNVINVNGKTVTEVLGLESGKASGKCFQSIDHYDVDLDVYNDIFDISPVMQDNVEKGKAELGVYDKLNKDMFLGLYKYKPKIIKESKMHSSTIINNRIMKNIVKSPEFKKLRSTCKTDEFSSALGTEIIGEQAQKQIVQWKEKIQELQSQYESLNVLDNMDDLVKNEEQLDDLMEQKKQAEELLDDLIKNGQENPSATNNIKQAIADINYDINNIQNTLNNYNAQINDVMANHSDVIDDLSQIVADQFSFADEFLTQANAELDQWGLGGSIGNVRIPYSTKKAALERIRNSQKLRKISDFLGRMRDTARLDQKKKSKDGATAIKSITTGDKIQDTLPSEKMKILNDTMKKDFFRRMQQKALMVYKKESHKSKNKGPIICCVDTSGSMSGSAEKWSKAVALAMLEIAHSQFRDFACILFSHVIDKVIVIEKKEINPDKILEIAERFDSGGTNFQNPLEESLKLIENSKFKKADILFITDGECGVDFSFLRRFNKVKEEKEFNVISVLINSGRCHDKELKEFSDKVINLSDLRDLKDTQSNIVHEIFGSV